MFFVRTSLIGLIINNKIMQIIKETEIVDTKYYVNLFTIIVYYYIYSDLFKLLHLNLNYTYDLPHINYNTSIIIINFNHINNYYIV